MRAAIGSLSDPKTIVCSYPAVILGESMATQIINKKKVIFSNVPPFIKDELLIAELSRHGKVMFQMKKIPPGCK